MYLRDVCEDLRAGDFLEDLLRDRARGVGMTYMCMLYSVTMTYRGTSSQKNKMKKMFKWKAPLSFRSINL